MPSKPNGHQKTQMVKSYSELILFPSTVAVLAWTLISMEYITWMNSISCHWSLHADKYVLNLWCNSTIPRSKLSYRPLIVIWSGLLRYALLRYIIHIWGVFHHLLYYKFLLICFLQFLPARKVKEKARKLRNSLNEDVLSDASSKNILAMTFRQVVIQQLWSFELVMFTPGTERNMEDLENPREVCQFPSFSIM